MLTKLQRTAFELVRCEEIAPCLGCSNTMKFWSSRERSVYILVLPCKLLPHAQMHENHIVPLSLRNTGVRCGKQGAWGGKFMEAFTLRCRPQPGMTERVPGSLHFAASSSGPCCNAFWKAASGLHFCNRKKKSLS